jgi:hypothetical protein
MIVSLPLAVGMIGFSGYIAALYGSRFTGTESVIPVVVVSGFFQTFTNALRVNYESKARQWTNLALYALWAVVLLLVASKLIPLLGAFGLGMSMVVAECALLIVTSIHLGRTGLPGFLVPHLPLFLFCLLVILSASLCNVWVEAWLSMALTGVLTLLSLVPLARQAWRSGMFRRLTEMLRRNKGGNE